MVQPADLHKHGPVLVGRIGVVYRERVAHIDRQRCDRLVVAHPEVDAEFTDLCRPRVSQLAEERIVCGTTVRLKRIQLAEQSLQICLRGSLC